MQRPSIKVALVSCLLGMFTMTGGLAYMSVSSLTTIDSHNDQLVDDLMPSALLMKEINVNVGDIRIALRNHVLAVTDDEQTAAEAQIADAKKIFETNMAVYKRDLKPGEEQQRFELLEQDYAAYLKAADNMLVFSRKNQDDQAKKVINGDMKILSDKMDEQLDGLVAFNVDGAKAAGASNQSTLERTINGVYTIVLGAFLIGIGVIAFALTQISRPINRITDAMRRLAGGALDLDIPYAGRADEIGAMAGAVDVFKQAAIANRRLEAETEAARRQAEADRIAAQEQAEAQATERLRIATAGLADGLRRLAAGDLSFELREAFAPDFEALRHNFNQSVEQLGGALRAVTGGFGTIDSGTSEIASSAADLSKRTEQQAAALEETAAALDQITVNVSNSTQRTQEARSVAVKANQSALESAEVVSQAENAMQKIEASSQQIANIISVIDEIAFQTNLLALNAGVEAARAGEAGKGFAVVAQEVRELAQRSAQAAKEIKALIQNSTEEVSSGVRLVRDAGVALKTIGQFIAEMNNHMESIAVSATEQATGLSQVNAAVNQMDQTTQQNAAMVEETTAASASLANEVDSLKRLLAQFQLGQDARAAAYRPASTAYDAASSSPSRQMMNKVAQAFGGRR